MSAQRIQVSKIEADPMPPKLSEALQMVPCANCVTGCNKSGTKACSACKLVSYCSPECQRQHWAGHKKACKDPMRSDAWVPSWVTEGRLPSIFTGEHEQEELLLRMQGELPNVPQVLWGNTPAIDILNLPLNENDMTKHYHLAFPASGGDLRHVVKTVNSLPANFSGKLTILLNDSNTTIASRNVIILLLLGTTRDEELAADMALHYWYSAFVPPEYKKAFSDVVAKFKNVRDKQDVDYPPPYPLGATSDVNYATMGTNYSLRDCSIGNKIINDSARAVYSRVRDIPSRREFFERLYYPMKSSHRIAMQEYRRTGIVLPFGADTSKFTEPNPSLFRAGDGKWCQMDYATPLLGWDVPEVIAAGKAYGVTPEDMFGCLYFFLSQQLRLFHKRLHHMKISIRVQNAEARQLASNIDNNLGFAGMNGLNTTSGFDRIMVSNIVDHNYLGAKETLRSWAPLLSKKKGAVILGYFMNWPELQPDGSAAGISESQQGPIRALFNRKYNVPASLPPAYDLKLLTDWLIMDDETQIHYDNSKAFAAYLKSQGVDALLPRLKLKLKQTHTIVPQRIKAPLNGATSALPVFESDDARYYWRRLVGLTWYERYVEFTPV